MSSFFYAKATDRYPFSIEINNIPKENRSRNRSQIESISNKVITCNKIKQIEFNLSLVNYQSRNEHYPFEKTNFKPFKFGNYIPRFNNIPITNDKDKNRSKNFKNFKFQRLNTSFITKRKPFLMANLDTGTTEYSIIFNAKNKKSLTKIPSKIPSKYKISPTIYNFTDNCKIDDISNKIIQKTNSKKICENSLPKSKSNQPHQRKKYFNNQLLNKCFNQQNAYHRYKRRFKNLSYVITNHQYDLKNNYIEDLEQIEKDLLILDN